MKKFALLFACAAVAMMTGCEGDSPSGTGGDMPVVTDVTINWEASGGADIVIGWSAVTDAEGYKVWFSETSGGTLEEVGDVAGTTYTHTAECAGYYYVTAYNGEDSSSGYSTAVNTMPNIINDTYIIFDNYSPADYHSGIYFGENGAVTGLAGSAEFDQDIYAYDEISGGDPDAAFFYSGDHSPFGDGYHTEMAEAGSNYGAAPDTGYWVTGYIDPGDVIFALLANGNYIKIYVIDEFPDGVSEHGTGVELAYEYQPHEGITLFTSDSSW